LQGVIGKIEEMGPKLRSEVIGKLAAKILNLSESTQREALKLEEGASTKKVDPHRP